MTAFDVAWEASELKHTVLSLKAVAEAFSRRFTEPLEKRDILLAIETAPEEFEYLYRAVFSFICEVKDQALHLEASAEELLDAENLREGKGNFPGVKEELLRNPAGKNQEEKGKKKGTLEAI